MNEQQQQPPQPQQPTTPPQQPRPFSWGVWIGGFVLALFLGGIANFIAGLIATDAHSQPLGSLIGAIPGTALVLLGLALRSRTSSLALGLCTGGCIILLIGGICGYQMGAGLNIR